MRKILNILIISMLMCCVSINGVSAIEETSLKEIDDIVEKYGLERVDELPNGVIPIEVDSIEELENSVKNIAVEVKDSTNTLLTNDKQSRASKIMYSSMNIDVNSTIATTAKVHLEAKFWTDATGRRVQSVEDSYWTLSGTTIGVGLEDKSTSHSVDSGVLYVSGRVTVYWYFIIDSQILRTGSKRIVASYNCTPINGIYNTSSEFFD